MELFLAQNHSAMTHLPIAAAVFAAVSALVALFSSRRELASAWATLSIVAFLTVLPAVVTGIESAKGRFNGEGKPYIEAGLLVSNLPINTRIWQHEMLGAAGILLSAALAVLGTMVLRGRNPNKYLIVVLAVGLAVVWAIGAHIGGGELWGVDTFPVFKSAD